MWIGRVAEMGEANAPPCAPAERDLTREKPVARSDRGELSTRLFSKRWAARETCCERPGPCDVVHGRRITLCTPAGITAEGSCHDITSTIRDRAPSQPRIPLPRHAPSSASGLSHAVGLAGERQRPVQQAL